MMTLFGQLAAPVPATAPAPRRTNASTITTLKDITSRRTVTWKLQCSKYCTVASRHTTNYDHDDYDYITAQCSTVQYDNHATDVDHDHFDDDPDDDDFDFDLNDLNDQPDDAMWDDDDVVLHGSSMVEAQKAEFQPTKQKAAAQFTLTTVATSLQYTTRDKRR